jgi:small subunit ribosomal protein S20
VANIKSAKKRVIVSGKKHERNRTVRSAVKTRIARVRRLVEEGDSQPLADLKAAVSALDRAAERGILHPRNAARRKSRLMRLTARAAELAANPEAAAQAAAEAKARAKGSRKATGKSTARSGGKTSSR